MNKALMTPEDFADLYKRRPRCEKGSGEMLPRAKKPHIVKALQGYYIVRRYTSCSQAWVKAAREFAIKLNQGE